MPVATIALGANIHDGISSPRSTLLRAADAMVSLLGQDAKFSRLYLSKPHGGGWQPPFYNCVVSLRTHYTPREILALAKALERRFGRRPTRHWGPRSLDVDLIDYRTAAGSWLTSVPARKPQRGSLVLPHPQMHRRAFVLQPLTDIDPRWRHPRSGRTAAALLRALAPCERAGVVCAGPLAG